MKLWHRFVEECSTYISLIKGRVRAKIFGLRGSVISQKVFFGARCGISRPWCVKIDKHFFAEDDVYLKIVSRNAILHIGKFVFVGRRTQFDVMKKVSIGDHTIIAPNCFITDHTHGTLAELRIDEQPCVAEPVIIGRDVWLGAGVVVLPGVTIGDGAIVGAHAVVTKDVPPMGIVAGVPARLLRYRDNRMLCQ